MTDWATIEENDGSFIESLLVNIEVLSQCDESSGTDLVPSKKQKYRRGPYKKHKKPIPKYQHIVFPRILKSDFRRKILPMFENVMNSFNYQLIYGFIHDFMIPDVQYERKPLQESPSSSAMMLSGATLLSEHFLLLLQISPDKIMRFSDIQVKQSSKDIDGAEVSCTFHCCNTHIYESYPGEFVPLILEDPLVQASRNEECLSVIERKRKSCEYILEGSSLHRTLFDPINGTFLKSRLTRIENLSQHFCGGQLTMSFNSEKRIEKVTISQFWIQMSDMC